MSKFKEVFDVHPDIDELFVVDGQPFLGEVEAKNFARQYNGQDKKIERVRRGPSKEELEAQKAANAEAKAKADAEKKAKADAKKKAQAEAKGKADAEQKDAK